MDLSQYNKLVRASNIIKRAMRHHRDRIFNLLITNGRSNVSLDVLIAHSCIYSYTNDYNYCLATIGCDSLLADIKKRILSTSLTPLIDSVSNSKKICRILSQSMTKNEVLSSYDHDWYMIPDKYMVRMEFIHMNS